MLNFTFADIGQIVADIQYEHSTKSGRCDPYCPILTKALKRRSS